MNRFFGFIILTMMTNTGFAETKDPADLGADRQRRFYNFLSYFEKVSLPYSIGLQNVTQCYEVDANGESGKSTQLVDLNFMKVAETFIPGVGGKKFSRMGRPDIFPVARFFPDDRTVAVVYNRKTRFASEYSNYWIAYFDLKGNIMGRSGKTKSMSGSRNIGFTETHNTQIFTILPSGKIETALYENKWKKDIRLFARKENKIVGFLKVEEAEYYLAGNKGIQEISREAVAARP